MPADERPFYHHHDEHSLIDDLASGLASGTLSRSQALKYAGAALLAGTLSIFGFADPAEAKRRRRRRRASCAFCGIAPGLSPICPLGQFCNIIASGIGCCQPSPPLPPPPPVPCSPATPCPTGLCCNAGTCAATCPAGQTCFEAVCVPACNPFAIPPGCPTGSCCLPVVGGTGVCVAQCPPTQICTLAGVCVAD